MVIIGQGFIKFSRSKVDLDGYSEQEKQEKKEEVENWAKQHKQEIVYA